MIKNFRMISIVLILLALGSGAAWGETESASNREVVLQLRWNHQFQFAGYYAAKELGYYEDEGLDVEIRSGSGGEGQTQFAPDEVIKGRAEFGVGSSDIILANDEREELMLVSSFFQKSPVRYYMLDTEEYSNLANLADKKVGIREEDLLSIEFKSMLRVEGVNLNRIPLIDKYSVFELEDLTTGKYDLIPGYTGGVIDYYAYKEGVKLKEIRAIDYGIDFYGDSLFTTKKLATEDPELVEKFRRASIKGWKYALENPEKTIDIILENYDNPEHKSKSDFREYNEFQSEKIRDLMLYPVVEIGNINPYRWDEMGSTLYQFGIIKNEFNAEKTIFNYEEIARGQEKDSLNQFIQFIMVGFLFSVVIFFINLSSKNTDLEIEIAEREEAEKRLKKERDRYEILFNSSIIGIVLTRRTGEIVQCNKKWLEMTGYDEGELVGRSMKTIISPEENEVPNELINKLIDGELTEYEVEQKYTKKDGGYLWGNLFMVAMDDSETDEKIYLNMVADITTKKMMEESVDRAEARFRDIVNEVAAEINVPIDFETKKIDDKTKMLSKLEEINLELEKMFKNELDENRKKEVLIIHQAKLAAMGEMIGNIAHQWRQPLNSLALVLSNLEDAFVHAELEQEYFDTCIERSRRLINQMSNTIDDFRYFFNPASEKEKFSPCESINSILYLLDEKFRFNDISVMFSDCDRNLSAYGYNNHYSQALFNVISNSADALADVDSPDKRIEIRVYEEGSDLVCEIEDNAGGIDEDIIDKVFEMYFTTKPGKKGTGLGLYITKTIIENNLNGKVNCENTKNGLMTKIRIPKESEDSDDE